MLYRFVVLMLLCTLGTPLNVFARMPSDPFAAQWAYEHTGTYRAWDTTTGSHNVIVAVIDNGFDTFHPDLIDNAWRNSDEIANNGVDDDKNGYIDDVWGWNFVPADTNKDGVIDSIEKRGNNDPRPFVENVENNEKKTGLVDHGTIVAGIIGAKGDNGLDGVGINWHVQLMNLKVLGNTGVSNQIAIDKAIYYAVDNGAHVINISMVTDLNPTSMQEAIRYAYERGVLVVAAAGNNSVTLNENPLYPICTDAKKEASWVVGVSAIAINRRLTNFSNIGSDCIDITAPGQDIASTVRYSPTNGLPDRYKEGFSGTSFATPMVSGAAALIKSIQPQWGAKEITQALYTNVHHTPGQDEVVYANLFGRGLLQIDKAVAYAASLLPSQPVVPPATTDPAPVPVVESTPVIVETPVVQQMKTPVWVVHPSTGTVSVLGDTHEVVSRPEVKNIFDITAFDYNGKQHVATVKKSKQQAEVTVYDEQWKKVSSFKAAFSGAVDLEVAQVSGDSTPEVILAPKSPSKTLFIVYSLKGKKLMTKNITDKHSGVWLAVTGKGEVKHIAAAYKSKKGVVYSILTGTGKIEKTVSLPWAKSIGSIASGDTNGDGRVEIVVTAGKGQEPVVTYYSEDGDLIRQFQAYDSAHKQGLVALIGNRGTGSTDEPFLLSLQGRGELRSYTPAAHVGQEWPLLSPKAGLDLKLLIQPFPLTK